MLNWRATIETALILGVLVGCFIGGFYVKGLQAKLEDAREEQAIQKVVDAFHDHEAAVGKTLEDKLARLKANQRVVEKHYERVVQNPVYRNVCLDDDGLRLIEQARTGEAPASQPAAAMP